MLSITKRKEEITASNQKKLAKSQRLSELMVFLEECCAGCWARDGRREKSHARPVSNCIGEANRSSQWEEVTIQRVFWAKFFQHHMQLEEKFKYCYWCRLPQDREYRPACHIETPSKDKACKYKWKIEHALAWILGGNSNFKNMCSKFGLDRSITAQSLGLWLKKEDSPDKFNNSIEVLLWFAEEERKFIFTDMI